MRNSRDWAGLPPDLLVSIADLLPVADYARFPAVCSSWASSIRDLPPKPPSSSHFPWLALIPADPTAPITFINRPENHRLYKIPAAAAAAAAAADIPDFYVGYRDGWLVGILDDNSFLLVNPLTSATSRLPSVRPILSSPNPADIEKVVLSASPGSGSLVALMVIAIHLLFFARPGDTKWTPLPTLHSYIDDVVDEEGFSDEEVDVEDAVYHDGKFFVTFADGVLLSFDLSGPSPVMSVLIPTGTGMDDDSFEIFLVSAPSGDLLQVRKHYRGTRFDVMRFDPELDGWVEVDDLGGGGDWSLFLDDKGSVVLSGMPGMDGNRIFFVDYGYSRNKLFFKIGVYDFGKGKAEAFFPDDTRFDGKTYDLLIWFRPSLS